MDIRDVWKIVNLIYHSKRATLSDFRDVKFDCRNDAFEMLVNSGALLKLAGDGQDNEWYELSEATRSLLDNFVLAWKRHGQTTLRVDYPYAFVAMPFAREWDPVFNTLVRPAAEEAGWEVARASEQPSSGSLMDNVANEILKAGLVIAEITTENRNVYYELGFAHALGKPAILLIQKGRQVPADLQGELFFEYDPGQLSIEKQRLATELQRWDSKYSATPTKRFY